MSLTYTGQLKATGQFKTGDYNPIPDPVINVPTTNLRLHMDFSQQACYSGTGVDINNISPNVAESNHQRNYDVAGSVAFDNTAPSAHFQFPGTNGVNDTLQRDGSRVDWGSVGFTVSVWCRPTATLTLQSEQSSGISTLSGFRKVIGDFGDPTTEGSFELSVGTNGVMVNEHGGGHHPVTLSHAHSIGSNWCNVTISYATNPSNAVYLAINGVQAKIGTSSASAVVAPGIQQIGGGSYGSFEGDVGQVSVFQSSLSWAQIASDIWEPDRAKFGL